MELMDSQPPISDPTNSAARRTGDSSASPGEQAAHLPAKDRTPERIVVAIALVVIILVFALRVEVEGQTEMLDHRAFTEAANRMRAGEGYYAAMDKGLRLVWGPTETTRAFRFPTLFVFWSQLPSTRWVWYSYLILVAITGFILLDLAELPICVLPATIYLLNAAVIPDNQGWFLQFASTEFWAVPFAALTLWAWKRQYNTFAACVALATFAIRETTAALLVGGILHAYRKKQSLRPWIIAFVCAVLLLLLHIHWAKPFLVPPGEGRETKLLGTGGIISVMRMTGFALPAVLYVGPPLWLSTLALVAWPRRWEHPALLYLLAPLAGLLADRPYWGVLVIPFTIVFTGNAVMALLTYTRSRSQPDKERFQIS